MKGKTSVRPTLFYAIVVTMGKNSEGYTLFPLLNKGEEEWVVHSLVGVHPLVSGTLSLGHYLLHGRKSCRLRQPSDKVFTRGTKQAASRFVRERW